MVFITCAREISQENVGICFATLCRLLNQYVKEARIGNTLLKKKGATSTHYFLNSIDLPIPYIWHHEPYRENLFLSFGSSWVGSRRNLPDHCFRFIQDCCNNYEETCDLHHACISNSPSLFCFDHFLQL